MKELQSAIVTVYNNSADAKDIKRIQSDYSEHGITVLYLSQ